MEADVDHRYFQVVELHLEGVDHQGNNRPLEAAVVPEAAADRAVTVSSCSQWGLVLWSGVLLLRPMKRLVPITLPTSKKLLQRKGNSLKIDGPIKSNWASWESGYNRITEQRKIIISY